VCLFYAHVLFARALAELLCIRFRLNQLPRLLSLGISTPPEQRATPTVHSLTIPETWNLPALAAHLTAPQKPKNNRYLRCCQIRYAEVLEEDRLLMLRKHQNSAFAFVISLNFEIIRIYLYQVKHLQDFLIFFLPHYSSVFTDALYTAAV
jgi:hypothetical protein